jgi:hypothetical protein
MKGIIFFIVHFHKIQSFSKILRETTSKSIFDHVMNFLKLDILWKFFLTTTTKTLEVKYLKGKRKVLKNSLNGQIWSDFEKVSLKMSGKA